MSFSFKSTSKRGGFGNTHPSSSSSKEDLSKNSSHRRSRSVSAVSRSCTLSNVVDFSNKMDNPLFCSTSSSPSPPDLLEPEVTKVDQNASKFTTSPAKSEGNCVSDSRRGRSVWRNSESGNQVVGAGKEIGRSSSRVDTGRRQRSVSRGRHESSEVWGQSALRSSECGNQALGARKDTGRSSSRVDIGRSQRSLSSARHESSEVCGQSASRHSECWNQNQPLGAREDRSSSRVNTGRRQRSLSRAPHESTEKKINVSATASDHLRGVRTLQKWSSQHPLSEPSDDFTENLSSMQPTNWEDGISTDSLSEVEEKTIKAISEQMKSFQSDQPPGDAGNGGIYETVRSEVRRAISEIQNDIENVIQRKNPTIIATADVVDIPSELVNPNVIELVSDLRMEYAVKLKQSQERARKLRADLAVEEHREEELGRILEEILPEPKSVEPQKTRPRRKNSVERWKMSKRLTEEAMNYFDECVSISTFDSSDFSSPEDQPVSLSATAAPPPVGDSNFFASTCSSASANYCTNGQISLNKESDNQVQSMLSRERLDSTASSSSKYPIRDQENQDSSTDTTQPRNLQFSFAHEASESVGLHDDIRNYIKKFEKDIETDGNKDSQVVMRSSKYDTEDYELQVMNERFLFDKVMLKSRIETGGLHLCCGSRVAF